MKSEKEFSLKGKEKEIYNDNWMSGLPRYKEYYKKEDIEEYLKTLKQKLIEDCDEILKNCDEEDYYSGYFYATKDFKIAIEKRFGD